MRARWLIGAVALAGCNTILHNGEFLGPPTLDNLVVPAGTLVPVFRPEQLEYDVDVGFAITRTRVVATGGSAIQLDGSELTSSTPSAPVALVAGATTDLHVSVAHGVTYTIHVHRAEQLGSARLLKPAGSEGSLESMSTPMPYLLYGDGVGYAVATDGDTLVLGAPGSDDTIDTAGIFQDDTLQNCGAVYVYRRSGASWTFDTVLRVPAPSSDHKDEMLGYRVGVSGDTVVATAAGAAYVWGRDGDSWAPPQRLSSDQLDHSFGASVAIDHDLLVVGAPGEDGGGAGVDPPRDARVPRTGAAYVFRRDGATWVQAAYLKASNPGSGDGFGASAALRDDTVVIGAPNEDSPRDQPNEDTVIDTGAVYVFRWSGDHFAAPILVKAAQPMVYDGLGSSLAVDGDLIVAGAQTFDQRTGRVVVFRRDGDLWPEVASLPGVMASNYGGSVGVANDTILVGAPNANVTDAGGCDGQAYLYLAGASGWEPAVTKSDPLGCSLFGSSVAISPDGMIVIGAFADSRANRGILSADDGSGSASSGSGVAYTVR